MSGLISWLVAVVLVTGSLEYARAEGISAAGGVNISQDMVCVVIRTYWAHGNQYGDHSLQLLLRSLQQQTHKRWEALLLVYDDRTFGELGRMVEDLQDSRIWIFAEWVKYGWGAKDANGYWKPDYHKRLYNVTDYAIRACPRSSRWVVITNGDNLYDSDFMATVTQHSHADAVAFDFYSRYQRPTAGPCDRFSVAQPGQAAVPPCKQNDMRFCQMDLAAVAWHWPRFMHEDLRFGLVDTLGDGQAADGLMASHVRSQGWKVQHVSGRCLVHHSPNPQLCAAMNGAWDDTGMWSAASSGGKCISKDAARRLTAENPAIEAVEVSITFDHNSFQYGDTESLELMCLRVADSKQWQHALTMYGRVCAAKFDRGRIGSHVPPHPWDHLLHDEL
ncbi:hypothetical protein V8C86DRAFT_2522953 [Haematococcus lacustris]